VTALAPLHFLDTCVGSAEYQLMEFVGEASSP
jgi:hypothetical protein